MYDVNYIVYKYTDNCLQKYRQLFTKI